MIHIFRSLEHYKRYKLCHLFQPLHNLLVLMQTSPNWRVRPDCKEVLNELSNINNNNDFLSDDNIAEIFKFNKESFSYKYLFAKILFNSLHE